MKIVISNILFVPEKFWLFVEVHHCEGDDGAGLPALQPKQEPGPVPVLELCVLGILYGIRGPIKKVLKRCKTHDLVEENQKNKQKKCVWCTKAAKKLMIYPFSPFYNSILFHVLKKKTKPCPFVMLIQIC